MFKRSKNAVRKITTRMPDWPATMSTAMDGLLITGHNGFVDGTHVASNLGWRAVEALSAGDKVLTFDHGMRTVVDIQRETLFKPGSILPKSQRPILVPEDALRNRKKMWLMPDLGMLVESETAGEVLGDPFVVVPARALVGFRGIRAAKPEEQLQITTLAFRNDEAIYVEGGMLAFCPCPRSVLSEAVEDRDVGYRVLDMRAARYLVRCLIHEDDDTGLICDPDEIAHIPTGPQRRPARPQAG